MTQNQVAYLNYAENKRNNVVVSQETNRHNLATESETNRHNVVTEGQEDKRIAETGRHNLVTEAQTNALNAETVRHNKSTEKLTGSEQRETHRHNVATEKQQKYNTDKQTAANRYNTDKQTAANIYATQVGAKTAANRMATDKAINSAKLAMDDANSWRDRNTKLQVAQITTKSNEFIKSLEQGMQNAKLKQDKLLKYKELKKEYTKILADLTRTSGMVAGKGLDALTGVMGNMIKLVTGSKK